MPRPILITDGTDVLGRALLAVLTAEDRPVRVLVRSPEEARGLAAAGAEPVEGDVRTPAVLDRALRTVEDVVLLSPPTPDQVVVHGSVIEAAERTGRPIRLLPVLMMGALPPDAPVQLARWHAVTGAQIRSSGLAATTLRPQLLMQHLLRAAAGIRADGVICGAFGPARLPHVDARDVAAAVWTVLTTPGHEGRSYVLTGPQALSYAELTTIVAEEVGRPVRYVDMAVEAYHEYLVGGGTPHWWADNLAALARLLRTGQVWPVTSTVAELTGRPARTLRQFVREHAATFRDGDAAAETSCDAGRPCATPL